MGEVGLHALGEAGVADREVDLVVEAEGTVVEVGGADDSPELVDDEDFGVNHGGLVLVDLGAGLEERAVAAAAGAAGEHVVGLAAGDEDADLDMALFDSAAELVR